LIFSLELAAGGIEHGSPQGHRQQGHAGCGGDFRSPRKADMPPACGRGLPVKARYPPQKPHQIAGIYGFAAEIMD